MPELEVVVGDVHLGHGLDGFSILEKLADDADGSIASGRVGITADETRDEDTPAQVLHNFLHRPLSGGNDQVRGSSCGWFPLQLSAVVPIHIEVFEHALVDHCPFFRSESIAVEQSAA